MAKQEENSGYDGSGTEVRSLFQSIYKFPPGIPSRQRLLIRTRQLHDLALGLEEAIRNGVPREFLCVYTWAVDYIALELKVITDRLEIQGKLDKE